MYGFIYFLSIPSMYMLLTIYAVTNLNDVSWGTRESDTAEKPETEVDKQAKKGTRTCFLMEISNTFLYFLLFYLQHPDKGQKLPHKKVFPKSCKNLLLIF